MDNNAGALLDGVVGAADHVAFTNAGTWKTNGVSDFGTAAGASTNTLTNLGLIQAGLDDPAASASSSTFANLGAFNNGSSTATGVVSMMNGRVGNSLTVSGLFTGAAGHSVLALDAFLGGPGSMADELHLTGGSAGQTQILLNDTNTGPGAINQAGIVLVTGASHASSFILDPATPNYDKFFGGVDHGFFLYQLHDRSGTEELTSQFNLFGGQLPGLLIAMRQIFDSAGLGFLFDPGSGGHDRLAFSDSGVEPPRVWMTASNWRPDALTAGRQSLWASQLPGNSAGLEAAVEVNQSFLSRSSDSAEPSLTMDAGYAQSTASLVGGMDLVRRSAPGRAFVFGLMSGYVKSD